MFHRGGAGVGVGAGERPCARAGFGDGSDGLAFAVIDVVDVKGEFPGARIGTGKDDGFVFPIAGHHKRTGQLQQARAGLLQRDGVAAAGQVQGAVRGLTLAGIGQGAAATDHDLPVGIGRGCAETAAGCAFHHAVERRHAECSAGHDGLAAVGIGTGELEGSRTALLQVDASAPWPLGIRDWGG